MSQDSVEQFLGRLLTDEDFRENAMTSFHRICIEEGFDLTEEERKILRKTDFGHFIFLANVLDGGIRRSRRTFKKSVGYA